MGNRINADDKIGPNVPYNGTTFLNHRTYDLSYGTRRQFFFMGCSIWGHTLFFLDENDP
jgi:hypothetical protein